MDIPLPTALSSIVASHLLYKAFGWFKTRQIVRSNSNRSVLCNITCGLLGAMFDDKTTKATQVNILFVIKQTAFDNLHKTFNGY